MNQLKAVICAVFSCHILILLCVCVEQAADGESTDYWELSICMSYVTDAKRQQGILDMHELLLLMLQTSK